MLNNHASVQITGELLIEMFGLPENSRIFNVIRDKMLPDIFTIIIENPDLPDTPDCAVSTHYATFKDIKESIGDISEYKKGLNYAPKRNRSKP